MQQPTLQNIRIRSTHDAHKIFYAVARRVLPMTTRRLDAEERRAICSGNVYIWEERCANSEATGMGMERWTDGMGWGPSRVRDEFLFYHQRENEANDDPSHPSAGWANIMRKRDTRPGGHPYSRTDTERLIKQTYSVHVYLPEDRPRNATRKWHLTAYFSQTTLDSLSTIDEILGVGDVMVPDGWFKSARASKAKRAETSSGDELASAQDPWGLGIQAASPRQGLAQFSADAIPHDPRALAPAPASAYMHAPPTASPYTFTPQPQPHHYAAPAPATTPRLPPLHAAGLYTYRDASPPDASTSAASSASSDGSPRAFAPSPLTPADGLGPRGPRDLVPLDVLQGLARPVRNPVDEQFLRRFASSGVGAGAGALDREEAKPRVPISVEW